jgi:hypothetical protein
MQHLAFTGSVDLHITYFEYSVLVHSVNVSCKKFICKVRFMYVRVTYAKLCLYIIQIHGGEGACLLVRQV